MAAASVYCEVSIGERLKHNPLFKLGMQHVTSDSSLSSATQPVKTSFLRTKKILWTFSLLMIWLLPLREICICGGALRNFIGRIYQISAIAKHPYRQWGHTSPCFKPKRKLARFRSTFFRACVFEVSCTGPVMRVLSDEQLMVLIGVFSP